MRALQSNPNIDNSDPSNYPLGRIKNNTGSGNGTPVDERVYGDLHQTIIQLMLLYDIAPSGLPDNVTNGYQIVEALKALASKNDYIYPLVTNGTDTLSIDIKLSLMKDGESLTCLASTNKTTETLIKGSDPVSMAVTYSGNFKANEYVRVIKTSTGASIIRIADWNSLNAMCNELNFLKKATQAEENAGAIDTVATTPLVNKVTFAKRVIGDDSGNYLAKPTGDPDERNGLLSKADKAIIDGIGASPIKNRGFFDFDPKGSSGTVPSGGDATFATSAVIGAGSRVTVTFANAVAGNYKVNYSLQSLSGSIETDWSICSPVFKPVSSTQFYLGISETSAGTQSIRVHFEVESLTY